MKRKFFSALLMGAMVVAATSTVTSCKDYDDDINNLQSQVDALSTLKTIKTDLEKEITDLKSQLEAADGQLQTAIANKADAKTVTDLASKVSSLESRIGNAENTLKEVNAAIDTNKGDIKKLNADLASVNETLARLEKGLTDEETARKAIAADLQEQTDALKRLQAKVANLPGMTEEQKAAIDKQINDLQKTLQDQITELTSSITGNTTDIKTLKDETIPNLLKQIEGLNKELATLNVFVSSQLRSLTFIPDAYYWGVEALKAITLDYAYITDSKWAAASADKKEAVGYDICERYEHAEGSTAKDLVAHYHMNPSTAVAPDFVNILDDDKNFETEGHLTRASAAGISVKSFAKNEVTGQLDVTLKFNDPNKIKSVKNDSYITVFATQAKYANKQADKDTTVTSDYAAVYKTTITDLVLSHTKTGDENSFTGQANTCAENFGNKYDNLHSTDNCTLDETKNLHLIPSVFDAMAIKYQDICQYDKTLDLSKLVETHYADANGEHKVLSAQELKDYGLEYKFELTASYEGTNKTSEAAHAAIKGTTFRPQFPKTDGKAYSWDEFDTEKAKELKEGKTEAEFSDYVRSHSVNRQPIVRVTLVDINNGNRVLDYGYIKIRISDKATEEIVKPNVVINYTGDPINYNSECVPAAFKFSTTWNQIEYDVLRTLNLHKEEFDKNYKNNGQLVINGNDVVKQFKPSTITTTKATEADELNPYVGVVVDNYDAESPETSTFTWTISSSELEKALYGKKSHDPFTVAVKYESKDKTKYPDLYIVLKTGVITIAAPSGEFLKADGSDRIKEYWYKNNGNNSKEDHGFVEIHAQTLSPEDPNAGSVAKNLDDRFSDVFAGNDIVLSSVTDVTSTKDFATNKRLYNFVFSASNIGKKFNGIETLSTGDYQVVTWTLGVSADGKKLLATEKNGVVITAQTIATIDGSYSNATGIKAQKVSYAHSDAAHSLLNYVAHNKLADDVLKAIVALKVKTNVCEHELALTENEFNVRFLRPINVAGVNKELEDAQDQKQKISLYDMVTLSDWRDYGFASHASYWSFYNIKDIRVIGNYTFGTENNQATGIINPFIYTTMTKGGQNNNTLDQKVKQSTISNQVLFRAVKDASATGNDKYGYLLYENLSSTVQTFTVRVPLEVTYEWGTVVTFADVKIKNTHSNAKRF